MGTDRIIEFQFSDGQYRLFSEFYASGNIVLTDSELNIIALLRVVSESPDQEELRVGLKYSLDNRQNYQGVPELTRDRVTHALKQAVDERAEVVASAKKKAKQKPGDALRKALIRTLNEFPPVLLDHALRVAEYNVQLPPEEALNSDTIMDRLMTALSEAQKVIERITNAPVSKGFIIARTSKAESATEAPDVPSAHQKVSYEDFHPFRPAQFEGDRGLRLLEFEPFNKAVDEFFSSIESQKLESRLTEREENAKRKLDAARKDHEKRLGGLQQVQELNVRKAKAIETNLQMVKEAVGAINGLIAQGMDWVEIARLIEMEQVRHNAVAELIKLPLKLYENTATLLLKEASHDDEEDYEGNETESDVSNSDYEENARSGRANGPIDKGRRLAVDLDLALSPWSNARQYYDQKRSAAVKEQKTLQSSAKALKSTERKVNADLKKGLKQEKTVMRPVRNQRWFEKFLYFISSEGYLVLGGRDAQQDEMLYKRHLRIGDVYVHADLQGAASVIIKNKPGMQGGPIPPSTLSQAGTLVVATSNAWDSKAVMSAWWVKPDQISRTAPTGEYLTTGAFTVRGQKNYLPPAQLLLGFGVIFQVSEESKARHLKHRLVDEPKLRTNTMGMRDEADSDEADEDSDARSELIENRINGTCDRSHRDDQRLGEFQEDTDDKEEDESIRAEADTPVEEQNVTDAKDRNSQGDKAEDTEDDHRDEIARLDHSSPIPLQSQSHLQKEDGLGIDREGEADGSVSSAESAIQEEHSVADIDQSARQPHLMDGDGTISGIRHLSAKERRQLRQNWPPITNQAIQPQKAMTDVSTEEGEAPAHIPKPINSIGKRDKLASMPQVPQVRGKHGKRNKQKSKYADQDEEDRALALRILGSAAGQQKIAEDTAKKKVKEEELAAQKERRRKQHALAVEKAKEAEEIRRLNMEEGIEVSEDTELEGLNDLDAYVGTPLLGDELLDALVVCGPWDAIGGRCRWRAKLQPGATKKGKAVREILGRWTAAIADREKRNLQPKRDEGPAGEEALQSREAELIKAIREQEVIGVVPVSKCRVIMGGGEKTNNGGGAGGTGRGRRGREGSKKQR